MVKTRSMMQGKLKTTVKKNKRGPDSSVDAKKTKSMDEVFGVEPMEFSDEEEDQLTNALMLNSNLHDCFQEPLSPRFSLNVILKHEEVKRDVNFFLEVNMDCSKEVSKGIHNTPAVLHSGSVVRILSVSFENSNKQSQIKITLDDIKEEISFWNSSLVCYILGANPPLNVLDGVARQLLKDKIDKVGFLSFGIFLIRFHDVEDRDSVLNGGYIFFNKRPVIMKAWDPNVDFKKEDVIRVPVWVTMDDLELKYCGEKSLLKIIGQVGEPIMVDAVTKERDKLSYPRVLIEVSIHQEFPHTIYFENEYGSNVPIKEWVFKKETKKPASNIDVGKYKTEAFQPIAKGWNVKEKEPIKQASTSNSFQALVQIGEGQEDKAIAGESQSEIQEGNTREGEVPLLLMDKIICWNVRGINNQHKKHTVKQFIASQKAGLVGLLETRVKPPKLGDLYQRMFLDADGKILEDHEGITKAFLEFYQNLLSTRIINRRTVDPKLIRRGPCITEQHVQLLTTAYTLEEVKIVVFSIPAGKAPRLDGYSSSFYQDNWDLVGNDVFEVVTTFLHTGQLLKEINSTINTLVPKSKCSNVYIEAHTSRYCSSKPGGFIKGKSNMNGPGNIAWEKLCKTKKVGGIGFLDIAKWNQVVVSKHVWAVATKKDNVRVKWVHSVYIDHEDWWGFKAPTQSSWYWKRIVSIKEVVKLIMPLDQFIATDFKLLLSTS
uniref:DUF4283 domain-containing protein n=1 Tax=Cannabis sativa TaxID=3483 RepID=A0A803Q6V5_CANSA